MHQMFLQANVKQQRKLFINDERPVIYLAGNGFVLKRPLRMKIFKFLNILFKFFTMQIRTNEKLRGQVRARDVSVAN